MSLKAVAGGGGGGGGFNPLAHGIPKVFANGKPYQINLSIHNSIPLLTPSLGAGSLTFPGSFEVPNSSIVFDIPLQYYIVPNVNFPGNFILSLTDSLSNTIFQKNCTQQTDTDRLRIVLSFNDDNTASVSGGWLSNFDPTIQDYPNFPSYAYGDKTFELNFYSDQIDGDSYIQMLPWQITYIPPAVSM